MDKSLVLATISDDTWNVLSMQSITPILKRWDYSDIPGGHKRLKDPPTWLKVVITLEKPPAPTHKTSWRPASKTGLQDVYEDFKKR